MSRTELKIYLWLTGLELLIVIPWCILFQDRFPIPWAVPVGIIGSAQLFFWFAGFVPRIGFKIAEENGKKVTSMSRSLPVIYLWMISFGIGSIYSLISPIVQGEFEKIIFFFVPFSMSLGAYLSIRHMKSTQKS